METLKSLLEELDATLRQYNMAAYENLLPPFRDIIINKEMEEIGIDDENVRALFRWKGGMQHENGPLIMNHGSLITFESIKVLIDVNEYYDPLLIPLISDNGEQILLFNTKAGKHYGKIYLFSNSSLLIEHPASYYDSLSAMIKTTIEAYKQWAYQYDEDDSGCLNINFDKFFSIARKNNPNSVYWTDKVNEKWTEWYEI